MSELYAVTEGAAGSKNGIAKTQSADVYAEIDSAGRSHIAGRITRRAKWSAAKSGPSLIVVVEKIYWLV
jgi:hypothetical protein